MVGVFQGALKDLTDPQIEFICSKFKLTREELLSSSEDGLDEIYDSLCDIEVDETVAAESGDMSDIGKMVSDIVTTFGNAIAVAEGYYDEDAQSVMADPE